MAATRLPGKPLADIAGQPMIVHVWKRAMEADIGRVIVATDDAAIADPVKAAGGEAVLTRTDHASGSDRIAEALQEVTKAILEANKDLGDEERELALDQIKALASQAAQPEDTRSRGVIKALLSGLGSTLQAAGGLAGVWETWGPIIQAFFQ